MKLVRWTPSRTGREWFAMQEQLNRIFDDMLARPAFSDDLAPLFAPPADIHETAEEFVVRMDLPGMTLQDIKVSLAGETLVIRGERKREKVENGVTPHRSERLYGAFERAFELGAPVRGDAVHAAYRDGVLEVRVPKAEHARVREIQIQSS
jgi:HSP20 family protein